MRRWRGWVDALAARTRARLATRVRALSAGRSRALLAAGAAGAVLVLVAATIAIAASNGHGSSGGVAAVSRQPSGTAASTRATGSAPSATPGPSGPALLPSAPGAAPPPEPDDVLAPLDPAAPRPAPGVLQARLRDSLAHGGLGGSVSYEVRDGLTGALLAARSPTVAREPASTLKILTAAAALSLLGGDRRLPTRVVAGPTPDEVVLVGGGDVLLSRGKGSPSRVNGRAGLSELAERTAVALRAGGHGRVAVRLDDSLFSGRSVAREWGGGDVAAGYVAPVMALEADAGRRSQGHYAPRHADPALAAAGTFAAALERSGIDVTGSPARGRASRGAPELARVESAPVADVVAYMLTESDNTVAEALARLVAARSGRAATFGQAGVAVLDRLSAVGLPVTGAHLEGGSGLGRGSEVSPRLLTAALLAAASDRTPHLRPLLAGLPVAAASGTLADRYDTRATAGGAGVVRAKTGTLTGVSSLAGTVVDADGRLLVFALMADKTGPTAAARATLDRFATALADCGCR